MLYKTDCPIFCAKMKRLHQVGATFQQISIYMQVTNRTVIRQVIGDAHPPGVSVPPDSTAVRNLLTFIKKNSRLFVLVAEKIYLGDMQVYKFVAATGLSRPRVRSWINTIKESPWVYDYAVAYNKQMRLRLPTLEHVKSVADAGKCPHRHFLHPELRKMLGNISRSDRMRNRQRHKKTPAPPPVDSHAIAQNIIRSGSFMPFEQIKMLDAAIADQKQKANKCANHAS